jgi:peptidoglycan/LPS O-acetylase OafA/YrhL
MSPLAYRGVAFEAATADRGVPGLGNKAPAHADLSPRLALAHSEYLGKKYFASLDGLRCVAIVSVMALHSFLDVLGVQRWGDQGVSLFFVISGFLITSLLLRERSRDGTISLKSFYIRRTLRIFPLYYTVLAMYVMLVLVMERHTAEGRMFFHNLPFFLTYTSNWFMDVHLAHTHFLHSWSLATEEQFYLVWPVVIMLAGRKTIVPVIFMSAVLVLDIAARPLLAHNIINLGLFGNAVALNISPQICMGSLLAYAVHFPRSFRWFYPVLGRKWSGMSFFVLAALIVASSRFDPSKEPQDMTVVDYLLFYGLYLAMVGIVGSACIRERHPLRPLLTNRVLVYIGTISYGMYMMNQLCRNAVPMGLHNYNQYLYFFATAGLTILAATISYYFYERRFLRIKDRFRRVEAKPDYPAAAVATVAAA